jgi:membrane protein implicated in regulation of membrane protease activity
MRHQRGLRIIYLLGLPVSLIQLFVGLTLPDNKTLHAAIVSALATLGAWIWYRVNSHRLREEGRAREVRLKEIGRVGRRQRRNSERDPHKTPHILDCAAP